MRYWQAIGVPANNSESKEVGAIYLTSSKPECVARATCDSLVTCGSISAHLLLLLYYTASLVFHLALIRCGFPSVYFSLPLHYPTPIYDIPTPSLARRFYCRWVVPVSVAKSAGHSALFFSFGVFLSCMTASSWTPFLARSCVQSHLANPLFAEHVTNSLAEPGRASASVFENTTFAGSRASIRPRLLGSFADHGSRPRTLLLVLINTACKVQINKSGKFPW